MIFSLGLNAPIHQQPTVFGSTLYPACFGTMNVRSSIANLRESDASINRASPSFSFLLDRNFVF